MKNELVGKQIVILGLARQGAALARFAAENGAKVIVSDMRTADQLQDFMRKLQDLDIDYVLGEHPISLLDGTDLLAVSGGVPLDVPLVAAARDHGIELTNDSYEFIKRTPATVIGITGSAGKTTTTALVGEMARAGGKRTWVGGNIGRPLIADLAEMQPGDVAVQELSSFQLEIWRQSPDVAGVLNITPNHLDRHKTMDAYRAAKANIVRYQDERGVVVLAADDAGAMSLAPLVRGRLRLFSIEHEVDDGAFVRDGQIWLREPSGRETVVVSVADVKLLGRHNLLNLCAAITLADAAGIPVQAMAEVAASFRGFPHRLEWVATINGVDFINDSIATAPERVLAALDSFDRDLILLAGGQDKNMFWQTWADQVVERVKHVVLFGALADMLQSLLMTTKRAARGDLQISRAGDLSAAFELAANFAGNGDVVLLSPGGTSYDAYRDFEERGQHFRDLVNQRAAHANAAVARKAG